MTFALDSAASAASQLAGGKIKALAVTTSERSRFLPSVPTLTESGITGYQMSTWYGLAAPKKLPLHIKERIYRAVASSMNSPAMKVALQNMAADPGGMAPDEFAAFVQAETTRWTAITAGFTVDK